MKHIKRILSMICAIGLFGLYLVTLISAFFTTPATAGLFKACIFATVAVPVFLYACLLIYRILKNDKSPYKDENK